MAHTKTCKAIILQVHDVGEADRFCIILTREYGRLAARARGVRKPKSRMGGGLLPLRVLTVELHEGSAGYFITGTHNDVSDEAPATIHTFMQAMQGIELILTLIEDGEEAPDIFDLTKEFLEYCRPGYFPVLPFTIRLLTLLGLLPTTEDSDELAQMTVQERATFLSCTKAEWIHHIEHAIHGMQYTKKLCENIVGQQNSRELRAAHVAKETVLSS